MIKYLVDTDYLSKRSRPDGKNVRRWEADINDNELAASVITVFEWARGAQLLRDDGKTDQADKYQANLDKLKLGYAGRILPIDEDIAEIWGQLAGKERKEWMDRGLVATAKKHGLIIASCNSKDHKGRGVEVIDPGRDPVGHWDPDGNVIKP